MPNLQDDLKNAAKLYLQNFILLFTAALLVFLGSIASLGLLAGPLLMGLIALSIRVQHGEKASLSILLIHLPRTIPCLAPMIIAFLIFLMSIPIHHIPIIGLIWIVGAYPLVILGTVLSLGFIVEHAMSIRYALKRSMALIMEDPMKAWINSAPYSAISASGIAFTRWVTVSSPTMIPRLIRLALIVLPFPLAILGFAALCRSYLNQKPTLIIIKKSALQIAGIILALLIAIGALFQINEKPKNNPSLHNSRPIPKRIAAAQRSPNPRNRRAHIIPNSSLPRYSGVLPQGFPEDIPIHPKAKAGADWDHFRFNKGKSLTVFPVDDAPDKVFAYYCAILEAEGWSIHAYPQQSLPHIAFNKPGRRGTLTVRNDQTIAQVYIRLE